MSEHPSLITKKLKEDTKDLVATTLLPSPPELDIYETTQKVRKLERELRNLKEERNKIFEELSKKASEIYAGEIKQLLSRVREVLVDDEELRALEREVLTKLNALLDTI